MITDINWIEYDGVTCNPSEVDQLLEEAIDFDRNETKSTVSPNTITINRVHNPHYCFGYRWHN